MKFRGQICIFSILKTFTEIVFVITTLAPGPGYAQLKDDFTDRDFSSNPQWYGHSSYFIANDSVLQLSAPAGVANAYLSTPYSVPQNSMWELSVILKFNPSGSNYTRIYLLSDQADLSGDLNGFFVLIGSSSDDISLFRQQGATKTKIIDGFDGRVNFDEVTLSLRIHRTEAGAWTVWSNTENSGIWVEEGSTVDLFFPALSGYFGFHCFFTSTRANKFFFDDIAVTSNTPPDSTPPAVDSVFVSSPNELQITFSEPIRLPENYLAENFIVDQNIGPAKSMSFSSTRDSVSLRFTSLFTRGLQYTLRAKSVADDLGNETGDILYSFVFNPSAASRRKGVIFTEIFSDPTPSVGLPETEFIEIFNRADSAVNCTGWTLSDASVTVPFPSLVLNPRSYAILTAEADAALFPPSTHVVGFPDFPSLNNSGDAVVVKDHNGTLIDSVLYSDQWYRDSSKKEGGWTLELIDINNICSESENWLASTDNSGGTPGRVNSVTDEKPDLTGPELVRAFLRADTAVLVFNEKLSADTPSSLDFQITPRLEIDEVRLAASLREVWLVLDSPQPRTAYQITVNGIFDCAGNPIRECCTSTDFAVTEAADSLDVVINEVLFNPHPGGVDFVEIVNISDKYIDLSSLRLHNGKTAASAGHSASDDSFVLRPSEYVAVTAAPDLLASDYPQSPATRFVQSELPPLNNDAGEVVLRGSEGQILDSFAYDSDMHSVFLRNKEGVSLERIAFNIPSAQSQNWRSAAANVGFATPGYTNSNFVSDPASDETFKLEPEIFLPIYGQPDFTRIHYHMSAPGNVCTIRIYDASGRQIKTIAENVLLGTDGFFQWAGDHTDGTRARIGPYMVWIQLYNNDGTLRQYRKRVVVAPKL